MARKYQRPELESVKRIKELDAVLDNNGEKNKGEKSSELLKLMRELGQKYPGIAAAMKVKFNFSAGHHRKLLELGSSFIETISPHTRILELGAGNGRLAAALTRGKTKPQYTIFDRKYEIGIDNFPLNRQVRRLVKKGTIKTIAGDFYEHDFGRETWHHILMPASFFSRSVAPTYSQLDEDRLELVKKLLQHVKIGGTLRASHFSVSPAISIEHLPKLHSFLRRERDAGRLDFKMTQIESPPEITKQYGPGTLKGLIITRLK